MSLSGRLLSEYLNIRTFSYSNTLLFEYNISNNRCFLCFKSAHFYWCSYTMYSFLYFIEWILIIRTQYETNSVLLYERKYDIIKKLESGVSTIELAKVHDVEKAIITNIKKYDIENYLKRVDVSGTGNIRKTLYTDVTNDVSIAIEATNNNDFTQMERANESINGVSSHVEALAKYSEKGFDVSKYRRIVTLRSYSCCNNYVIQQLERYGNKHFKKLSILIGIRINEILYQKSDSSII